MEKFLTKYLKVKQSWRPLPCHAISCFFLEERHCFPQIVPTDVVHENKRSLNFTPLSTCRSPSSTGGLAPGFISQKENLECSSLIHIIYLIQRLIAMALESSNLDGAAGERETSTESAASSDKQVDAYGPCGGDIDVSAEKPSTADLKTIEDLTILDVEGKSHPFKSLYSSEQGPRRVLVLFIRHFFCGVCALSCCLWLND